MTAPIHLFDLVKCFDSLEGIGLLEEKNWWVETLQLLSLQQEFWMTFLAPCPFSVTRYIRDIWFCLNMFLYDYSHIYTNTWVLTVCFATLVLDFACGFGQILFAASAVAYACDFESRFCAWFWTVCFCHFDWISFEIVCPSYRLGFGQFIDHRVWEICLTIILIWFWSIYCSSYIVSTWLWVIYCPSYIVSTWLWSIYLFVHRIGVSASGLGFGESTTGDHLFFRVILTTFVSVGVCHYNDDEKFVVTKVRVEGVTSFLTWVTGGETWVTIDDQNCGRPKTECCVWSEEWRERPISI